MKRLGVGFIGAGFVTNTFHVNAWRGVRYADITGICDLNEDRAKTTAGLCKRSRVGDPRIYTDVCKLVKDPNVDAVWITVPNFARIPITVSAEIASLKWTRPDYIQRLKDMTGGKIDYSKVPVEDFARANVLYETPEGILTMVEVTTSWSFIGPGLKLSFELLGPEYYMQVNTLSPELNVFFSREVKGKVGEDMVEKQAAEQGLMPVVADEASAYGYRAEDRHMVESFLDGRMPRETWEDGAFVVELLMACYMAAERGKKLRFPPKGLEEFVPKVAQGTWNPKSAEEASPE